MTQSKFGDLLPGTPFQFKGEYYVKILPLDRSPCNAVQLRAHDSIWGMFPDGVIVEIEDEHVAPKENRLQTE